MNNTEKAKEIRKAIKLLESAASAYGHGRTTTGYAKLGTAIFVLDHIWWPEEN
jgi:hypothetical protein